MGSEGSSDLVSISAGSRLLRAFPAILICAIALGIAASARAEDGKWVIRADAMVMDAWGHDQHILTIHDTDTVAGTDDKSAVLTDIDSGNAFRIGKEQVTDT